MKSIKKKLSIIALATSILGCKSAMAMAPLSGNSLISAGCEYFNGKKKSGRDGSKEKSQKRDKVNVSLPIPTLDDLKVWVPGLYLVANEIAGDVGFSNHEFFGKHTVAKAARSGAQYAAEKIYESVDYLKNKRETAKYIKDQRSYDEHSKIKREKYYYENLEKVLLNFGVGTEISSKLVDIMNIQKNPNGDGLSYNFLSEFLKNGEVPFGDSIAQKIDVSGFRVFVDNLRGKCKLDIDEDERFIFGDMTYRVEYMQGCDVQHYSYQKLRVTNLNSQSVHKNGLYLFDYADFFWKT